MASPKGQPAPIQEQDWGSSVQTGTAPAGWSRQFSAEVELVHRKSRRGGSCFQSHLLRHLLETVASTSARRHLPIGDDPLTLFQTRWVACPIGFISNTIRHILGPCQHKSHYPSSIIVEAGVGRGHDRMVLGRPPQFVNASHSRGHCAVVVSGTALQLAQSFFLREEKVAAGFR